MKIHDRIELRETARLIPYARNSRTHSASQISQIAGSIREFGFTNPVLIDESGGIIAGHGRVMAAQLLAIDRVPCLILEGLTEAQRRAYVIADNQIALNAGWNEELLRVELLALRDDGFDLELTGFDPEYLDAFLAEQSDPDLPAGDADEELEPEEDAVSVAGDLWVLGSHRIICGDSTDPATVAALLAGATPHLMVTDPPYGIEYDASWRGEALQDGHDRALGKVKNDDRADWGAAWALFGGDVAYVWHAEINSHIVAESLIAHRFQPRALIVWGKNNHSFGRGHYHHKHEPCWYVVRKGGTGHWSGDRTQTTLWDIDKPMKSETGHSTQKPVECMARPIRNNSASGDAVYEPFSGSGTTIIAAEQEGRRCFAVELNPLYVDMAVRRWQRYTGKAAVHAVTGEPFPT